VTIYRTLCVLAVSAIALPVYAQAPPTEPSDEELRQCVVELERQLREIKERLSTQASGGADGTAAPSSIDERFEAADQNLRILERKWEIERDAAAAAAKVAPAVGASREGFQLRSADGSFQLRLRGLVHSDGRFFADDAAEIAPDTFTLRRVRPILDATVYKIFDLRLMPDFGGGTTVLQDAYIDLRFTPALRVRGGKFKSPFGLERLASASELLFLERAAPTGVAPNRDVGLMLHGDVLKGDLSYAIGAFDGVVDGGSTDADDRDGKDVVARLFVHPFRRGAREALKGLGVGVAGSYGKQNGSITTPGLASYRTTGQQIYFRYRSDGTATGTVFADGTRYRYSAQGYYYYGRFGLLAEQVFSSQDVRRGVSTATLDTNAWQVAGSWVLTGEPASYRAVTPKYEFDRSRGKWGAFELTARYHQLTPDGDAFPLFANLQNAAERARAWTGGVNWYLNRNVKAVLDYEQTRFDGGAVAGDRPTEHGVFTRLQFSF
jgi:phosphate-selective porin OprO/OprP